MKIYLRQGWDTTKQHSLIIVVLFMYQMLWGFFLYRFIQSVVVPLLHRFPGDELSQGSLQLFLAESQFQVSKTDITHYYLWMLLGLFVIRMLLTPVMNAGIYYSIYHDEKHAKSFLRGIKQLGKSFLLIYWIQIALTLLPLYWLLPRIKHLYYTSSTYQSLALDVLPYVVGFLLYAAFLQLCFVYVQLGKTAKYSWFLTLTILVRGVVPACGLGLLVFLIAGGITLVIFSLSMVWAGLIAIIVHQAYYVVKMMFKIWGIASQYHLWKTKIA